MLQNDRRADAKRQSPDNRDSGRVSREWQRPGQETLDTQTLSALLAGVSPEQLSVEQLLALSQRIGNSAVLELISLHGVRADAAPWTAPAGEPQTAPAEWSGGAAEFTPAPEFSSLAPLQTGGAWAM